MLYHLVLLKISPSSSTEMAKLKEGIEALIYIDGVEFVEVCIYEYLPLNYTCFLQG